MTRRALSCMVVALVLAAPASAAWTPRSASSLIASRVRVGLVQQLFEITGSRRWYPTVKCVSRDARLTRFSCAAWAQDLRRSQDFWTSPIRVTCKGSLTECEWVAVRDFAGPWSLSG